MTLLSRDVSLLPLILFFALLLRLPGLSESAYYDELYSIRHLDAPTFAEAWRAQLESCPTTVTAPGYFVVQYAWGRIAGTSLLAMRILSLAFGLAATALVHAIGKRLFSPAAGRYSALFAALSLSNIYFSVEARMYACALFLSAASVYAFLRIDSAPRAKYWWLAHFGANVILTAVHPFMAAILAAEFTYLLLFRRNHPRRIAVWTALHATLFVAAVAWVYAAWSEEFAPFIDEQYAMPTPRELANAFVVWAGGRYTNWNPAGRFPAGVSLDVPLAALAAAAAAGMAVAAYRDEAGREGISLILLWLVLPTAVIAAASVLVTPVFVYRYVLSGALALNLLTGAAVAAIPRPALRRAFLGVLVAFAAYQLLALREPLRPDYAAAARIIRESAGPGAAIIGFKTFNRESLAYNSEIPREQIELIVSREHLEQRCLDLARERREIWIVFWRWDDYSAFEEFLQNHGLEVHAGDFGGLPPMRLCRILSAPAGR